MNSQERLELIGNHAILSPSSYSWINYGNDIDKYFNRYRSKYATMIGTALHEIAADHIKERYKLSDTVRDKKHLMYLLTTELLQYKIPKNVIDIDAFYKTIMMNINDGIRYRMDPEKLFDFSDNCFGTADAVSFKNKLLRIHDLKTGKIPAHMEQLEIYAALFCLEHKLKVSDIDIELRIYQNEEILSFNPTVDDIVPIMDTIINADKYVNAFKIN